MKLVVSVVLVASIFSAPSAFASGCDGAAHMHSTEEMASSYFDKMDLNGDKIVTKKEFETSSISKMVKSFDVLQPDDNGKVEREAFIKSFIKAHFDPKLKV